MRVRAILAGRIGCELNLAKKLSLTAAVTAVLAMPILVGILNASAGRGQANTQKAVQQFEVASIKLSAENGEHGVWNEGSHERVRALGMTIKELTELAYDMPPYQVLTATGINNTKYDVIALVTPAVAKLPDLQRANAMRTMLRTLLNDRFKLGIHNESRDIDCYSLKVSPKGVKVKVIPAKDNDRVFIIRRAGYIEGKEMPIAQLVEILSNLFRRQVIDETGIRGKLDVKLDFAPLTSPEPSEKPSIFTVLEEQLGLKLEAEKKRMNVVIIDRADKPTEN
jgi:uncharacterized protein (TIGR03435 family)